MPKQVLPRRRTRLPKGTKRDDYEPEVLQEFDRERGRIHQARYRNKQRHVGIRDVTFLLDKDCRDKLERLCKMQGQSKSRVLAHLIMEAPDVEENP